MTKVIDINAQEFQEVVLSSDKPVLVDFWAPWCAPCRMMAPILDELSLEKEGSLKVVKINVDEPENIAIAQEYDIRSIPNMKLFKSGKVVKEFIGLRPKALLLEDMAGEI